MISGQAHALNAQIRRPRHGAQAVAIQCETSQTTTDSPLGWYKHERLSTDKTIRLLRFESDRELSLHIEAFPLSELPTYIALSYTWGSAICDDDSVSGEANITSDDHNILVNGKLFQINVNLFDALVQLQKDDLPWIWIDAICIDQSDDKERSCQVILMGDIYSGADRVIIWLGKDPEDVDMMLWTQSSLYEEYSRTSVLLEVDEKLLQALGIDVEKWFQNWESVERFFRRRRWYRRAWVLQEAVLAKRIELRNGETLLDWERLSVISWIGMNASLVIPSAQQCIQIATHMRHYRTAGFLQSAEFVSEAENYGVKSYPHRWCFYLLLLVRTVRNFQSSCEHDKVYAALGLAGKIAPPEVQELFSPDYASSWEHCYMSFTLFLLRQLPGLLPLSFVEGQGRATSLPSWCPDYRTRSIPALVTCGATNMLPQFFSASGSAIENERYHGVSQNKLTVKGLCVDTITQRSPGLYQMIDPMLQASIEPCLEICAKLPPIYPLTGQVPAEVLWRTMLLDHYGESGQSASHPAPDTTFRVFDAWIKFSLSREFLEAETDRGQAADLQELLERFRRWQHIFEGSSSRLPTAEEILEFADLMSWDEHPPTDAGVLTTLSESNNFVAGRGVKQWATGRCLFRSAQHETFGLGPEDIEEGDEIWLLKGAFVPFILRPRSGGEYVIVGEAYVHGIMHGEWLKRPGQQNEFVPIEIV